MSDFPLGSMASEQGCAILQVAALLTQTEIGFRGGPIDAAETDVKRTFVKYAEWLVAYKQGDPV